MSDPLVRKLAKRLSFFLILAGVFFSSSSNAAADVCPSGWYCYGTSQVTVWTYSCDAKVWGGSIIGCESKVSSSTNIESCNANCVSPPVCSVNDSCDPNYDAYGNITSCVWNGGTSCSVADCCALCTTETCGGDGGGDGGDGGTPPPGTPPPSWGVSGTVFQGDGSLSGGVCTGSGTPIQPGAGSQVNISGKTAAVDGSGSYSSTVTEGTYVFTLQNMDPQWVCSCPVGCQLSQGITQNATVDFYVTEQQDAWWQTIGGDIHANTGSGNAIRSLIPNTCSGSCLPYLSLFDSLSTANSSGVVSYAGGAVDVRSSPGNQTTGIDEAGSDQLAQSTYLTPAREDYPYFYRLFELGLDPSDDFAVYHLPGADAPKPNGTPLDGKNAFFSSEDLYIDQAWTVTSGESITVFVDGDLNLGPNTTTFVNQGGFLAFVVSGNIAFDPGIGSAVASSAVADIEGVFIANGTISTGSFGTGQDNKFIGEGIFVGWSGISLQRDFRNMENNTNPAELFRYRPDLLINAPNNFLRPLFRWEEVAP